MTMLVLFLEDQVEARVEEMPVKLERLDHLVDHQQIPHLDIDKDILVEQLNLDIQHHTAVLEAAVPVVLLQLLKMMG